DKIEARASELGIAWPSQGVYSASKKTGHARPPPIEVVGPDGSSVVKTGGTYMQYDAPLVDVLSLVSLAAEERVRGVVEQAAALARSRRVNSHGVVGETWRGMAKNATDRDGQGRGQGAEVAAKLESKERDEPYNAITEKSRKLIDADARTERDRAAKRAKRSTDAAIKAESRAGSVGPEGRNCWANGEAAMF
ncbi:hypothetical protein KEM55_001493, partial [Ascosphaera atra]